MKIKIKIILYLISLLVLSYLIYEYRSGFYLLFSIKLSHLSVILLLCFLGYIFQSAQFYHILQTKANTKFKEIFLINNIGSFYNYILPGGGVLTRGLLLNKLYNLKWSSTISLLSAFYAISYIFIFLFTFAFVFYLEIFENNLNYLSSLNYKFYLLVFSIILLLLLIGGIYVFKKQKIAYVKEQIVNIFSTLKKHKSRIAVNLLFLILYLFTGGIVFFGCFYALGLNVSMIKIITIHISLTAFLLISITPGNIGIREMSTLLFSNYIGIENDEMFAASMLYRIVNMIIVFASGLYGKYYFLDRQIVLNINNEI